MSRGVKCHWNLWDIQLDVVIMLWGRWMSGLITCLCGCDKRMRYLEEPLHVICWYLPKHNKNLTRNCYMVLVMHPPIVDILIWQGGTNRRWRNGLNVPELSYHPIWLNCDHNRTPSNLALEARNELKPLNSSVVTIGHPAHVSDCQSIQTCPIRQCS